MTDCTPNPLGREAVGEATHTRGLIGVVSAACGEQSEEWWVWWEQVGRQHCSLVLHLLGSERHARANSDGEAGARDVTSLVSPSLALSWHRVYSHVHREPSQRAAQETKMFANGS